MDLDNGVTGIDGMDRIGGFLYLLTQVSRHSVQLCFGCNLCAKMIVCHEHWFVALFKSSILIYIYYVALLSFTKST